MVLSIRMNICLSFLNDLGAMPRHICSVWRHSAFVGSETRNMVMQMVWNMILRCSAPHKHNATL